MVAAYTNKPDRWPSYGYYPEARSQLSKYPLLWMIHEAQEHGPVFNAQSINLLVWGMKRQGNRHFAYDIGFPACGRIKNIGGLIHELRKEGGPHHRNNCDWFVLWHLTQDLELQWRTPR